MKTYKITIPIVMELPLNEDDIFTPVNVEEKVADIEEWFQESLLEVFEMRDAKFDWKKLEYTEPKEEQEENFN